MAAVWGRAVVEVDADGTGLPAKVRTLATKAGEEAGVSTGKGFSRKFRETLDKEENATFRKTSDFFKRLGTAINGADGETQKFNRSWKELPHGLRQGVFWTGLVISSMSELAALSSVAGAGLLTLGSAATSMAVGLGTAIAGFTLLLGDINNVPDEIRPARDAFDGMVGTLKELRKQIAISMFTDTQDAFASLGETVTALTPAFVEVGKVLNGTLKDFAKNLKPGTRAFNALYGVIEKAGPIFDRLLRSAGNLGVTLLDAFNKPSLQRAVQGLLGWIDDLFKAFDNFVQGNEFDSWVDNAIRIFGDLGGVLEAAGDTLNHLVDQKAIDMLSDFLKDIAGFLEGPARDILDFAKELNIFGIIAQLLNDFGKALEPLGGPLIDLASGVRKIIDSGIQTLAPVINDVAKALAPFVQQLADFINAHPKEIADALVAIGAALGTMWTVGKIGDLSTSFGAWIGKMDEASKKAPTWKSTIGAALGGIVSSMGSFDGEVAGQDIINGIAGGLLSGAVVGGPIGAAIGAVSSLITSMIGDMVDKNHGVWNNGWDQIFAPGDYSGVGIGDFKRWMDEQFTPWWINLINGWGGMLDDFRDIHLTNWWNGVVGLWNDSMNNILLGTGGWADQMVNGWVGMIDDIFTNIGNFWTSVKDGWVNFWTTLINDAATNLLVIGVNIGRAVLNWWGNFQAGLANILSGVQSFFTNLGPNIIGLLIGVGVQIGNAVSSWASDFSNGFSAIYNTVVSWVNRIIGQIQRIASNPFGAIGSLLSGQGLDGFASGGVLSGPRRILAGEAGPEAIVPLNRPLGSVDPSVRWLSAIAQGKVPAMANGGVVGGGLTLADGAIQVIDRSGDSRRTANEVVMRLFERVA